MLLYLTKRAVFTRWKVLKRGRYFVFASGYCHKNVLCKVLSQNISGIVKNHIKFCTKFFKFGNLSQKSSSWFRSCTVKYINQKCHNFNFSYLHKKPEFGLTFKNLSSWANSFMNQILIYLQVFGYKTPEKRNSRKNIL